MSGGGFLLFAATDVTISGLIIYWTMRRRNASGLQKVFW
jgi:hypothetical protein